MFPCLNRKPFYGKAPRPFPLKRDFQILTLTFFGSIFIKGHPYEITKNISFPNTENSFCSCIASCNIHAKAPRPISTKSGSLFTEIAQYSSVVELSPSWFSCFHICMLKKIVFIKVLPGDNLFCVSVTQV